MIPSSHAGTGELWITKKTLLALKADATDFTVTNAEANSNLSQMTE